MKVLIVCESYSDKSSGGKVARYLCKIASSAGHKVEIAVTHPLGITSNANKKPIANVTQIFSKNAFINRAISTSSILTKSFTPQPFRDLISRHRPDIVHFASFDHTKPSSLYYYCLERDIPILLQPWTMHFFCAQGFAYRNQSQCYDCLDKPLMAAYQNGCINQKRKIIDSLDRPNLKAASKDSRSSFLSSNSSMDSILKHYGIPKKKIFRFPVPFDCLDYEPISSNSGDYYIFYGQAEEHKGISVLIELFGMMPKRKLVICPMSEFPKDRKLPNNVTIVDGAAWGLGLDKLIAGAKGVVIPSLWSTTTEYTLYEAMLMEKPIFAFNVGVHKDILVNQYNAILADPLNPFEMIHGFDLVECMPELCIELVKNAKKTLLEINSIDRLGFLLSQIYEAACHA